MVPIRRHARHRRSYAAIGGLVLDLTVCHAALAVNGGTDQGDGQPNAPANEATGKSPKPLPVTPVTEAPRAYVYPYSCEHPQNAQQDNLCIERKAAKAAEDQAKWASYTVIVGIAGTVAVVLTLIATTIAAWAAHRGADAAKIAADAAARSAALIPKFERAYLAVGWTNTRVIGETIVATLRFINNGKTPQS